MSIALLLFAAFLAPPEAPAPLAAIEGRVVHASTGAPLRKVTISLHKVATTENIGYGTMTDAEGRFAMRDLEAGGYILMASRNGFVRQQYGAKRPGRTGAILTLTPGQKMTELLIRMAPHAVITGRVVDTDNEPVGGAQVQLMQPQYLRGKRELQSTGFNSTNDLGEYRIYGVGPGRYYINVSYRGEQNFGTADRSAAAAPQEGFLPVYYPGVPDVAAATPLDVPPGGELRGINVTLRQVKAVRIRGKVTGLPPGQYAMAMLTPNTPASRSFVSPQMNMVSQKDGSFEIKGVTPGSYYLTSMAMSNQKDRLTARALLEVGSEDVEGANLTLSSGTDIKGIVKVEDGELDPSTLHVSAASAQVNMMGSGFANAAPKPDGTFTWEGMSAENVYIQVSGLKPGAYLKSIRVADREVTDPVDLGAAPGGLELLVSLNGATVQGAVKGSGPKPPAGASVVLVPDAEHANLDSWYHSAATDQDGRYKLESVRPGKYTLYAFEDLEPGSFMEPGFLKPFSKYALPVDLAEKAHVELQPELIPLSAMDGSTQ